MAPRHGASDAPELSEKLQALGIDVSRPGFYDDPAFIAEERRNPEFLQKYAQFVDSQHYTAEYLDLARTTVQRFAEFLFQRLKKDGRLGACVDLAMALSRMLERHGIWNYIAKGCLTLTYRLPTATVITYISPIVLRENPATLGHAWIVAPPFRILDLTISRQKNQEKKLRSLLPAFVVAEATRAATFDVEDFLDQDALAVFMQDAGRMPTLRDIERMSPGLLERAKRLGCVEVPLDAVSAKYTTCAVTAPDVALEGLRSLRLSGKYPHELYEELSSSITP